MQKILVLGAGKIGSLISVLLASVNDYQVYLGDIRIDSPSLTTLADQSLHLKRVKLNAETPKEIVDFIKANEIKSIASALPFFRNLKVIEIAKELNLNYFDLTEDVASAAAAFEASKQVSSAFVPQCGLAPGFISIVTNSLMKNFDELFEVKMRVGALPVNVSNALQYSLTWSTDGLINEYGNPCYGIEDGKEVELLPLDGLEEIKIDGLTYEAFNTSGGIGSLATTYQGRVQSLTYKTIRYPGHCSKMHFLMHDLKLNEDRETLKRILENCLPITTQDEVLVYVSVTGKQNNQYIEDNYVKKFYPKKINDHHWSAIQLTTASSLCAVIDMVLSEPEKYKGFVKQEQFSLQSLMSNRFGEYYA